ncbi:hypothetical protein [Kitasatospora sp. P5_F3]
MSAEIAELMTQAGPYVASALSAYGGSVLARAEDAAVDTTANFGRQLLQSVWRRVGAGKQPALEAAIVDAANDGADSDAAAALRYQITKALHEDADLREEIASLVANSPQPQVNISSLKQDAVARDHGVVFQQGSGTQIYGPK